MGHSRFSPSATERDFDCPASFLLNEQIPDVSSNDADHGTAAHFIGKLCLEKGRDVDYYAGCRVAVKTSDAEDGHRGEERFVTDNRPPEDDERVYEVDDEMIENVQRYVAWCRELPGEHHVEVKVEHTDWCPDFDEHGDPLDPQYGTSDHVACIEAHTGKYDEATIVITDLKYGRGVKVFAKGNKQATKYALGTWKKFNWLYDFKRVVIRIAQPRIGHFDVWECSIEELLAYGEEIKKRLDLVFVVDAPFGPTEKACKFCKVSRCKARQKYLYEQAVLMLDEETGEITADPRLMDDDELLEAWRLLPLLEIHINKIRAAVHQQLMGNHIVGELFLVESTGTRQWDPAISEEDRAEMLRKAGIPLTEQWNKTFISPAQAEAKLPRTNKHGGARVTKKERAAIIKKMAHVPAGYPVVAEPGDKRKRYVKPETSLDGLDEIE